ncbi:MAG TPA: hypothetical protein VMT03_21830 [Polyangia bacterium]|nr:hypothetical protein [Polyangia bacterium]
MALAWAHGRRIAQNLGQTQWEDAVFFRYTRDHIHTLYDCFRLRGPYPGLYRPLTTNLFYFVGLHLFGERVAGYHVILVVLVVANAVLLHRIAARMLPGRWALVAPVVWASRLASVEVVTHTCEFQGLFSAFWLLLAIDGFADDRHGFTTVAFALALLSKETATVLPGILFAYHLTVDRKPARAFAGPLVVSVVWITAALAIRRQPTGFGFDPSAHNVLRNLSAYLLSFSNLLVRPLSDFIMPASIIRLADHPAVEAATAILILLDLLVVTRGGRARLAGFGFAWWLVATLPVLAFEQRLFMRYAYFGHAGLALAIAAGAALAADAARDWSARRRRP